MSPATLSLQRRLDGVSLHALHLADLYLTLDAAAAYAVTPIAPDRYQASDPRETSGPRIDRTPSSS